MIPCRKGIVDIEFVISILVFLTVLTFVTYSVIAMIPRLHQVSFNQDIKSKAFQLSELMMFDEGEPKDWGTNAAVTTIDDIERMGFSSGRDYSLDTNKISKFNAFCNAPGNYAKMKDLLGLDYTNDVLVDIKIIGGATVASCHPVAVSNVRARTTLVRLGLDSANPSTVYEMTVSVM